MLQRKIKQLNKVEIRTDQFLDKGVAQSPRNHTEPSSKELPVPQTPHRPNVSPYGSPMHASPSLVERGYQNAPSLRAECSKFKCAPGATACCCRRLLYNEPDFVDVESLLEQRCRARGFQVLFLPKFHPELNPIEQCWGFAKRIYRDYPKSSTEAELENNVKAALAEVKVDQIRKFADRSIRFGNLYLEGKLNGKQAAWAARKYAGHRTIPDMAKLLEEVSLNKI